MKKKIAQFIMGLIAGAITIYFGFVWHDVFTMASHGLLGDIVVILAMLGAVAGFVVTMFDIKARRK